MSKLSPKHTAAIRKIYLSKKTPFLMGIYCIGILGTNDCYIGSSAQIFHRWNVHKYSLEQGVHHNYKLQAVFNERGLSAFYFTIIWKDNQKMSRNDLYVLEQKYIDSLKPTFNIEKNVSIPVLKKNTAKKVIKVKRLKDDDVILNSRGKPMRAPKKYKKRHQYKSRIDPNYLK